MSAFIHTYMYTCLPPNIHNFSVFGFLDFHIRGISIFPENWKLENAFLCHIKIFNQLGKKQIGFVVHCQVLYFVYFMVNLSNEVPNHFSDNSYDHKYKIVYMYVQSEGRAWKGQCTGLWGRGAQVQWVGVTVSQGR